MCCVGKLRVVMVFGFDVVVGFGRLWFGFF